MSGWPDDDPYLGSFINKPMTKIKWVDTGVAHPDPDWVLMPVCEGCGVGPLDRGENGCGTCAEPPVRVGVTVRKRDGVLEVVRQDERGPGVVEQGMEDRGFHRADMQDGVCCACGRDDLHDDGTGVTRWHKDPPSVTPDYGPPLLIDGERCCPNCKHPLTDLGTDTQWAPKRLWRCISGVDPATQEPRDYSGYEYVGDEVRE